jgi:hypothetical protein
MKESQMLQESNLMPDIDTENVKTNLQEFFRNPNLL